MGRIIINILLLFCSFVAKTQIEFHYLNKPAELAFTLPAGCIAWYKSDAGVTISGGVVTNWADQSGNGRDLASTANNKPVFTASALNGYGAVDADNVAGRVLQTAGNMPAVTSLYIYAVMKMSNSTGSYGRYLSFGDYDVGAWIGRESSNNNLEGAARASAAPYGSIAAVTFNTFKLVQLSWDGASNVLKVGSTTGSTYTSTGTTTPGKLTLYSTPALTTPSISSSTEIIIFDAPQPTAVTYLNTKFGL